MRRPHGLSARLVVAIGMLAALHLAVFVVLLVTLHDLRDADRRGHDAAAVGSAASDARAALGTLDSVERGIVIVGPHPAMLREWRRDGAALRAGAASLDRTAAVVGEAAPHAIAMRIRAYLATSAALAASASQRPALLRRGVAAAVDARRGEGLQARLAALVVRERAFRKTQRDHVANLTQLAWLAGLTGVGATLLCATLFLVYVRRALLAPLREVASAARALAAGDLDARVSADDGGIGEVAELARTFDQMAASLQESRAALERQNAELDSQRAELVEAVRSAREGARILRAVLDATPDAIALLDAHGAVLVDNPPMRAVRAAFGAHATAVERHGALVALDHGDTQDELRDEISLLGTARAFARYAAPVHDERGRLIGRLLVLREITGEREAERAKEDFFALVSHELRTPLTAILGYVELVLADESEEVAEEHGRHLAVVERNAQRLLRLVGDLLYAAQVEGGTLLLEPGIVDLPLLVRDAVELAAPRAEGGELALVAEIEPVGPCVGDRDRLAQVLDNLISNAIKFTPPGGQIVVRLAARDDLAQIEVADTGVGIPEEDVPRLFDRFYRARNATARAVPGLGLGLVIVRAIVNGHGGTIAVRSDIGRGTTFTVLLPLRVLSSERSATQLGGR